MKVVKLTYGTHGKSKEYAYLTNGDARNGQIVQPAVTHKDSGKVFGTTGVIQHVYKLTSASGQTAIQQAKTPMKQVYTDAELGVSATGRSARGTFTNITGLGKTVKADGKYAVPANVHFIKTSYVEDVRQGNVDRQGEE